MTTDIAIDNELRARVIEALLPLGRPADVPPAPGEEPDYRRRLGLGSEHVPALVSIVRAAWTEEFAFDENEEDNPQPYVPIHAWRALAQMRAVEALEPLIHAICIAQRYDDDWFANDFPHLAAMMGPPAVAPLQRFAGDARHELWPRASALEALGRIGQSHPETRAGIVSFLVERLGLHRQNDPTLNAFIIVPLLDLRAVDAADAMQRAFEDRCVDTEVIGDWDNVRKALGLAPAERAVRRQRKSKPRRGAHGRKRRIRKSR
jgi:hypothetical protein